MEYARHLEGPLRKAAERHPVVTVTGPRQSGKTTLVRAAFPGHAYRTLEDPDIREFASTDPRGFLGQFEGPVVLDEAQRVPDLLSYIQGIVDREGTPGRFVLSGSQNFLLMERVSQSLAGRAAVLHLLPFSLSELERREPLDLAALGRKLPDAARTSGRELMDVLFAGCYPRIHDRGLPPPEWLAGYYRTYVERDVREVLALADLGAFGTFVRLCAGRTGQILNLSSLGSDCGISHTTARRWLSVLEASFLVTVLRPHHRSFNKRLIKSPKLYFLDTGLLCYLLQIRSAEDLLVHASRGAVFESFVLSELIKNHLHRGVEPDLYFWRDSAGHEVDFLLERGSSQLPIEAKSGQTVASDFFKDLAYWKGLAGEPEAPAALFHGGTENQRRREACVYSWSCL